MELDWRLRALNWMMKRGGYDIRADSDPARIRAAYDGRGGGLLSRLQQRARQPLHRVTERVITGRSGPIPVRIYQPTPQTGLPLLVYFHGGGWVLGNLDTHDPICRRLAVEAGAVVMAVDYRLAPEHKFPAAVEDAYDAVRWAADHAAELGAGGRLCVGGDSAGANMAAVVCQLARDEGGPAIDAQLLIYPSTDGRMAQPSISSNADAPLLTREAMTWFRKQYLPRPEDAVSPLFSPLLAADHADLPPALILTAEHDPLLDDGRAYARVLRAAGTPVSYVEYEGLVHGFLSVPLFRAAREDAFRRLAAAINGTG